MNDVLLRWLSLSLLKRLICLLVMSLLLLTLAWLALFRPQQQASDILARKQAEMVQQVQQRQHQFAVRPTINALESEIARLLLPAIENAERGTIENLVATRGTQLESWLPGGQPQQLQLRLDWPQFLPLFGELALTHASVPQRFELRAEQGVLNTQLWLEDENAE